MEVVEFLESLLAEDASLDPAALAQRVKDRFGLTVHPRSIERALARRKKTIAVTDATRGEDATAATTRYERLRSQALAGTRSSGLGLVVLIREGVAAWLELAATPSTTITSITEPIAGPPIVPGDVQAEVISVLANMAMAISQEVHQ